MRVGTNIKLFTAFMFGVVVTGHVLKVSKDGQRAKVRCSGGGATWDEKIHINQLVTE